MQVSFFLLGEKMTFIVAWQMETTKGIILDMFETDHMNLSFIHRCFTTSRIYQRNVGSRENKVFEFAHAHVYIYIYIYIICMLWCIRLFTALTIVDYKTLSLERKNSSVHVLKSALQTQQSKRTGRRLLIENIIDSELESDFVFIRMHVAFTSVSESKMKLEIQLFFSLLWRPF